MDNYNEAIMAQNVIKQSHTKLTLILRIVQKQKFERLLEKDKASVLSFSFRYTQKILIPFNKHVPQTNLDNPSAHADPFLRKKYRRFAKLIHPDKTQNQQEKEKRNTLLARASAALYDGDSETLSRLIGDVEGNMGTPLGDKIELLEFQIRKACFERAKTRRSEMWKLMKTELELLRQGRDLLQEMYNYLTEHHE